MNMIFIAIIVIQMLNRIPSIAENAIGALGYSTIIVIGWIIVLVVLITGSFSNLYVLF